MKEIFNVDQKSHYIAMKWVFMRQLTHGIYRETFLIPTDTKGKMIKFPIFNRKKKPCNGWIQIKDSIFDRKKAQHFQTFSQKAEKKGENEVIKSIPKITRFAKDTNEATF